MTKQCGIYKISSPSGKCYIGQSIDIKSRFYNHKSALRRNCHTNYRLQGAFRKYGDLLTFEVLEICEVQDLDNREQFYIDNSTSQYNMTRIAKNSMLDKDIAKKVSITKKKNSEITSRQVKDRWEDEEYKIRVSKAIRIGQSTDEYKSKISKIRKDMWTSDEHRQKLKSTIESRRELLGPTKKEIFYDSTLRKGSAELSKVISEQLRKRHSDKRHETAVKLGIQNCTIEELRELANFTRRTGQNKALGLAASNMLRNNNL